MSITTACKETKVASKTVIDVSGVEGDMQHQIISNPN